MRRLAPALLSLLLLACPSPPAERGDLPAAGSGGQGGAGSGASSGSSGQSGASGLSGSSGGGGAGAGGAPAGSGGAGGAAGEAGEAGAGGAGAAGEAGAGGAAGAGSGGAGNAGGESGAGGSGAGGVGGGEGPGGGGAGPGGAGSGGGGAAGVGGAGGASGSGGSGQGGAGPGGSTAAAELLALPEGTGEHRVVKVMAGGDGELYVLGSFTQSVTWGTSTLTGAGPRSAYLLRLESGGGVTWTLPLGGDASTVEPTGMARDTAGNLLVVGRFVGKPQTTPAAGADTLTMHGQPGLFVLKVSADGAPLFLRSTAPPPDTLGDVIEVASRGGQSFVMPRYGGALKYGFYSVGTLPGDLDFALFRLNDDATPNAAFNVREPDAQSMMRLGVSSAGTPMVLGRCTNYVTVDGKTLSPCKGLFLWHLNEGAGFSLFDSKGQVTPWLLRNAPGEGAIFSASFDGEIQLGDSKVFANGDPDSLVVASLGSNDKVINKTVLHGPGPREARDLAYLNASARALTGIFKGKLSAQGLALAGSTDLWQGFVVGLATNLQVTWQLGLTGEQLEVQPSSVAHIPGGTVVVAGSVRGEGALAGSPVSAPVERSFLVRVTPP